MKSSKWVIIMLVVVSMALLVSIGVFGWDDGVTMQSLRSAWREPYHPEFMLPFEIPPLVSELSAMATIFLLGVIGLYLAPDRIAKMGQSLHQSPLHLLRYILVGFLSAVLLTGIAITSALTFITFPMTILLGIALLISSFFGSIAIYFTLGSRLLHWAQWDSTSPLVGLLLGVVLLNPLFYVPYLGGFFRILVAGLGLGIVIATRFGSGSLWSLLPLVKPGPGNSVELNKERSRLQE